MSETGNPYRGLPDSQFWRRAVSGIERHRLDPVVNPKFTISRTARIATAGSCFAQHISRKLMSVGFNYFVSEDAPELDAATRKARNYGTFTARFGDIYTTRQLLQLFLRAFGHFDPQEQAWQRPDGRFVDPYRPNVEPDGYNTPAAVRHWLGVHLTAVRQMFHQCDVFVFTMGLTEGWRSRIDGAVFPLAPGVVAGEFDAERHEFVNFGVHENEADMSEFLERLRKINPRAKVLLTVSPVPLIATYEPRHVLVSTTYSKSVLRVAAESMQRAYPWVDYFPSYEIITGSFNGGIYYQPDFREVTEAGVAHAMRCFTRNYLEEQQRTVAPKPVSIPLDTAPRPDLICDEEALDQIRG